MAIAPMIINITEPIPFEALKGFHKAGRIKACVVFDPIRNKHFRISENTALEETLVFQCNEEGHPITYREVAGGGGTTLEDILKEWAIGTLHFWEDCFDE